MLSKTDKWERYAVFYIITKKSRLSVNLPHRNASLHLFQRIFSEWFYKFFFNLQILKNFENIQQRISKQFTRCILQNWTKFLRKISASRKQV